MPRPRLQPLTSPWPPTFTSPLRAWEPDVDQAGPLFVLARCGMIYMEPHQLGWKPLKDSYMDTLPSSLTGEHKELVRSSGPFPSCPSLSPYSSSQRSSRIIFTFIITEGKKEQETPWLSLIILLPGYLPFFWLSSPCGGHGVMQSISPFSSTFCITSWLPSGEFWCLRNVLFDDWNVTPFPIAY